MVKLDIINVNWIQMIWYHEPSASHDTRDGIENIYLSAKTSAHNTPAIAA